MSIKSTISIVVLLGAFAPSLVAQIPDPPDPIPDPDSPVAEFHARGQGLQAIGRTADDSLEVLEERIHKLEERIEERAESFADRLERRIEERIEREVDEAELRGYDVRVLDHHRGPDAGPIALWLVLFGFSALGWAVAPRAVHATDAVLEERPGASFATGLASFFLFLPAMVIGVIILAVSIVGIPLLPLWVAILPAAFVVFGVLGMAAMGRELGDRILDETAPWVKSLAVGLGVLFAPVLAGWLLALVGLHSLAELLLVLGWGVLSLAYAAGVGAALIALIRWRKGE